MDRDCRRLIVAACIAFIVINSISICVVIASTIWPAYAESITQTSAVGITPATVAIPASGTAPPAGTTQITNLFTSVSGGSATAPMQLPLYSVGSQPCLMMRSTSAVAFPIYPPSGGTVGTGAANVPNTLYPGVFVTYCSNGANSWIGGATEARQYATASVSVTVNPITGGAVANEVLSLASIKAGDAVTINQVSGNLPAGVDVAGDWVITAGTATRQLYNTAGLAQSTQATIVYSVSGEGP